MSITLGFIGYKSGSLIRGWHIENAQPEQAGALLLEKFCKYSRAETADFFRNNIDLKAKNPQSLSIEELYDQDWVPTFMLKIHVKDDSRFIRDPILCEFGYVFDFSHPSKQLLTVFSGLGTQPSKGYEQYSWVKNGQHYYMNAMADLTPDHGYPRLYIEMLAYMYRCPALVESLYSHQHEAIKTNARAWLDERVKGIQGLPRDLLATAAKNYVNGEIVSPSGLHYPRTFLCQSTVAPENSELSLIEKPRHILWR